MFACGYSGVRVAAFFEKLAHFLAFIVKVGVVTAEASQSEERMGWHFLRVVDERTNVASSYETHNKTPQMGPKQSRAILIFLITPTTT